MLNHHHDRALILDRNGSPVKRFRIPDCRGDKKYRIFLFSAITILIVLIIVVAIVITTSDPKHKKDNNNEEEESLSKSGRVEAV